jgi:hypothetical protein
MLRVSMVFMQASYQTVTKTELEIALIDHYATPLQRRFT